MNEISLELARAIYPDYYPYDLSLQKDQAYIEFSMSWDFPQKGKTFDLDHRFTGKELGDSKVLGKNVSIILMMENPLIYEQGHRKTLGLQTETEPDQAFWTKFGAQIEDLIRYEKVLSENAVAEIETYPTDPISQQLLAVGVLTRIVLNHVRMKLPKDISEQIFEDIDWAKSDFGRVKAHLSPIISYIMRIRSSRYDPPVKADDYDRVLALLTEQVSSEKDRSLYDQKKIKNLAEAQRYLLSKNNISIEDMLATHRVVLDGLMDNAGKIRSGVILAGSDRRKTQPVKPEKISDEITTLLSEINNPPNYVSEDDKYLFAARIAAKFQLIHPFQDGNGRVGHIITNYLLSKLGLPIFKVDIEHNKEYIDALDEAIGEEKYDALITIIRKYKKQG